MELLQTKVLVINRFWQGYEETTAEEALRDVYRGVCTAIDTSNMTPVRWEDWAQLPVREGDLSIRTIHGSIRIPTVICKSRYASMPKKAPKWSRRGVAKRDKYICQITGVYAPDGNVDHVHPRKLGGRDGWENTAWVARHINAAKGHKTLEQLGWKLRRPPKAPPVVGAIQLIPVRHADWKSFLCV